MLLDNLYQRQLIHPPKWLPHNTAYLVVMGSQAYGVSNDASDQDIYGMCIPPKELIFPHLAGEIPGFGRQIQRFEVWQEHKVKSGQVGKFLSDKNLPSNISLEDVEAEMARRGLKPE